MGSRDARLCLNSAIVCLQAVRRCRGGGGLSAQRQTQKYKFADSLSSE